MSAGIVDETIAADSASQLERILAELDAQAAQTQSQQLPSWHHRQGPFGVFSAFPSKEISSQPHQNVLDEFLLPEVNVQPPGEGHDNLTVWEDLDRLETEFHQPSLFSDEDLTTGTSDVRFGSTQPAGFAYPDASQLNPVESSSIDQLLNSFNPTVYKNDFNDSAGQIWRHNQTVPASISTQDLPEPRSPYLPPSARYLLWHYANHTIPSLSGIPLDHESSPWNELHLPTALKAYAELNVLGASSLPRVSLLYSLLSITCFQLGALHKDRNGQRMIYQAGSSSPFAPDMWSGPDWEAQAVNFRSIAQTGLNQWLRSFSTALGDNFKYKDVLLAAVSLVCIRVRESRSPQS